MPTHMPGTPWYAWVWELRGHLSHCRSAISRSVERKWGVGTVAVGRGRDTLRERSGAFRNGGVHRLDLREDFGLSCWRYIGIYSFVEHERRHPGLAHKSQRTSCVFKFDSKFNPDATKDTTPSPPLPALFTASLLTMSHPASAAHSAVIETLPSIQIVTHEDIKRPSLRNKNTEDMAESVRGQTGQSPSVLSALLGSVTLSRHERRNTLPLQSFPANGQRGQLGVPGLL